MRTPAPRRPRAAVVLLAAGEGRRVGADRNKVLLPLAGEPVLARSLRCAVGLCPSPVVVVVRDEDRPVVARIVEAAQHASPPVGGEVVLVTGGDTRHASERNALTALAARIDAGETDVVAIHDAARPLAGQDLFQRVLEEAHRHGGALPVVEQTSLLPRGLGRGGWAEERHRLVAVQTPQAFRAVELLAAYRAADRDGFEGTDTAATVERYTDLRVRCVTSDASNLKITFPEDVLVAERLLAKLSRC